MVETKIKVLFTMIILRSVFYSYLKLIYGTNAVLAINISINQLYISSEFLFILINTKIIIVIIEFIRFIALIKFTFLSSFDYFNP